MDRTTLTRADCRRFIETRLFEPANMAARDRSPGNVGVNGVELELFPYRIDPDNSTRKTPVSLFGNENSLSDLLVEVSKSYGGVAKFWQPVDLPDHYKYQVEKIEFPNGDRFLFEPGGQVEISTAPCAALGELEAHLLAMQGILATISDQNDIHFVQTGTNPWFTVAEIGNQLIKPRYKSLENYFDGIGPFGKQMMLQTCSMHINKDLPVDVPARVKQLAVANLVAPFVTAMFANSSQLAGGATGHKAHRSYIWQHADPARTGVLSAPGIYERLDINGFIDAYLDFALKAPLVYIYELVDQPLPQEYTFDYWLENPIAGISPGLSHFENHVSLLFPEVRMKGYLELRSIDAPPVDWQMVPICFYSGILSNEKYLDETLDLLLPYSPQAENLLQAAIFGLESDEIYKTSVKLMQLAIDGFSSLATIVKTEEQERKLTGFYERFIIPRLSFADVYS